MLVILFPNNLGLRMFQFERFDDLHSGLQRVVMPGDKEVVGVTRLPAWELVFLVKVLRDKLGYFFLNRTTINILGTKPFFFDNPKFHDAIV